MNGLLSGFLEDETKFKVTPATQIFEEEPVPLDVFVRDSKFMNMPHGLSEVQFDFVQHAERVYKKDLYQIMADEFGGYWAETKDVRMTNKLVCQWAKGCLLAGEEVYNAGTGQWVPVEQLEAGLTVGFTEQHQVGVYEHSASFYRGRGESFKVTTSAGTSLKVYGAHKFLTRDGFKKLWDLKVGDQIAQTIHLTNTNPIEMPEHEAEILGWWSAPNAKISDGVVQLILPEYRKSSKRRYRDVCAKLGISVDSKYSESDVTITTTDSLKVNELLTKYKLEQNVRVPKAIFSAPRYQVASYLSGIYANAGFFTISKDATPRAEISLETNQSEDFLLDIQKLLLLFSVTSDLNLRSGINRNRLRIRRLADLYNFSKRMEIPDRNAVMKRVRTISQGHATQQGDVRWVKIKEIESLGEHDYYDLTVDEVHNYVAGGGLISHNSGKDLSSRVALLRIVYLMLCLRSPQSHLGMPESDSIHLLNMAFNANQARTAFFEPMTRSVKEGWFADKAEPKKNSIVFAKNLEAISGHSSVEGLEGLNLLVGVADEIDAFRSRTETNGLGRRAREVSASAEAVVEMLVSSGETRFDEVFKQITISYPRYKGSKIQQMTEEAKKDIAEHGRESNFYASGPYATWEVHPGKKEEDFALAFRTNPVEAAAKYACQPTASTDPYFRDMTIFENSIDRREPAITVDYELVTKVSEETGQEVQMWEPIFTFAEWFQPSPGALYAMHGDLAVKSDRAGIAMSHVVSWDEKDVAFMNNDGELDYRVERLPKVRNDFTIAFSADIGTNPPREIKIRWARELAFQLIKRNFNVKYFSFDQYQSKDTMQILEDSGIESERISTDLNNDVWRSLKDIASDGRLVMEENELLTKELTALVNLGRKIDHPDGGSKDLADAFGCSIAGALKLGGSESDEADATFIGDSIFGLDLHSQGLANMPDFGVLSNNILPIGMTMEAPINGF